MNKLNEFIKYLEVEKRYSINTVKAYKRDLSYFKNYLNIEQRSWMHPCSGEIFNSSVFEIFAKAHKEEEDLRNIILLAYEGKEYSEKLNEFYNSINFDGKIGNLSFKYADSVYKR